MSPIDEIALISIRDRGSEKPKLVGWHDVLELAFDDVSGITFGYLAPNKAHAAQIVAFINAHEDRCIIAHCEAGISRSAAVCRFLVDRGWQYRQPHSYGLQFANPLLYSHLRAIGSGGDTPQGTDDLCHA